jgi:hypothetical protein
MPASSTRPAHDLVGARLADLVVINTCAVTAAAASFAPESTQRAGQENGQHLPSMVKTHSTVRHRLLVDAAAARRPACQV